MYRFVAACSILAASLSSLGCCTGPFCGPVACRGGNCSPHGCESVGLCADETPPACGGCGHCLHCRRWGALQAARNLVLCTSGCGDIYYDEWLSDPPVPRDPCDFGYCPGPLRQLWWTLSALHPVPRPRCCIPDDCAEVCGYADEGYEDSTYYDGGSFSEMESVPMNSSPRMSPQPETIQPRPAPFDPNQPMEKAQRGWGPRVTGGVRMTPHRAPR